VRDISVSDLENLPAAKPAQSGHPWWVWFRGEVDLNRELACKAMGCTYATLVAKLGGFRSLKTATIFKLVEAWVAEGRIVDPADVGRFVLLHGKINMLKEDR
jgi:hypothetical protein